MSITFNADEIFEMAEAIERNAAVFYREAAGNSEDPKTEKMLLGMGAMEEGHEKTFAQMRKELSNKEKAPTVFDPDNEAALYLQTMAAAHGTEGRVSLSRKLTGNESIIEVLQIALEAEKNSVVFYSGIRNFVPAKSGKDRIDAIIREELFHIATINQKFAELKK